MSRASHVLIALALAATFTLAPAMVSDVCAQGLPDAKGDITVDQVIQQGETYLKTRKYTKAESAFKEAISRDPKAEAAHLGLAKAFQKQKRWKEAIAAIEAGQKDIGADWAEGLYQLAYSHRNNENYKDAIRYYNDYNAKVKDNPDAFYGLGVTYEKVANNREAVKAFKRYIELEKRPSEKKWVDKAKARVAELEKDLGPEPAEAPVASKTTPKGADKADKGARKPRGTAKELLARGDDAFGERDYKDAVRYYEAAADKDDEAFEAPYKQGVALALANDLTGAIKAWEEALVRKPGLTAAKRNIKRARAKLQASTKEGIDDPRLQGDRDARLELAAGYLDEGRAAMAMRALDRLIIDHAEDPAVRALRGQTLMALGRYPEATFDLELAFAQSPGDMALNLALGQCYLQSGDNGRALYFLKRYISQTDPAGQDESLALYRETIDRLEGAPKNSKTP